MARNGKDAPAGTTFDYAVTAYGPDAATALSDAAAWQSRPGKAGAGSQFYGRRTVPVRLGTVRAPQGRS